MKKALLLFAFSCFSNLYAQESDMFSCSFVLGLSFLQKSLYNPSVL